MRQVDHPYNPLNLPKKVVLYDEESEIESEISYLYDANGVKMEKTTKQEDQVIKKVNYQGMFQYTDGVMDFIHTAEGYTKVTHNEEDIPYYNYVFNYTDHLGNVRVSWTQNPDAPGELVIIGDNHYYPFGLAHKGYQSHPQVHYWATSFQQVALTTVSSLYPESFKYKYNGKELQDELGLNWHDYGARNYDPALGRWMNIDPLSEEYFNLTPYNYVANIPTIFIDPDGMKIVDPDEIVKDHKENIQNTIKELQKMVKNGSMSEDIGNMLINVSENALSEINSLEKSSQVYNVFTDTIIPPNVRTVIIKN